MASVQQANIDKKAAIAEAINEAKSFFEKNNAIVGQFKPAVSAGAIKNNNSQPIRRYRSESFRGNFVALPPEKMDKYVIGAFLHKGQESLPAIVGSKGAFVYGTLDSNIPEALGWLLAWDNPDHPTRPVKVYVEAGYLSRLLQMDRNEIERKLEDYGSEESHYPSKPILGPAADAKIEKLNDKVALIGANFDYYVAGIIPPPKP